MTLDLEADTALVAHDVGHYAARLSPEWNVWGMNGGYLAAVGLRAAGETAGEAGGVSAPAAISAQFLHRPEPGLATVSVEVVRRTRRAECRDVVMRQADTPIMAATVWCATPGPPGQEPSPRTLPPPESVPSLLQRLNGDDASLLPWQRAIEDRPLTWPDDWYTRTPSEPVYEAWFRFTPWPAFASDWLNAARALVIADIYPVFGYLRATPGLELTCRAATMSLSAQFHRQTDQEDFLFGDCRVLAATGGLLGTATSVWNRQGLCCATAIQQNLLLA